MVRRWSYINNLTSFFFLSKSKLFLKKKYKLFNLKKSISLKRFNKKYTKFKRKAFNRIKHKNNWLLYHNIFKYWNIDYRKSKKIFITQFASNLFLNNFFFFNFFYFKKNLPIINNYSFIFFFKTKQHIDIINFKKLVFKKNALKSNNKKLNFFFNQTIFTSPNVLTVKNDLSPLIFFFYSNLKYLPNFFYSNKINFLIKNVFNFYRNIFFLTIKIVNLYYKISLFLLFVNNLK